MTFKKFFVFSFFCLSLCLSSHVARAEMETVRVAQFGKAKFLLYLPLYVAQEEGFFAKQNIEIDLKFVGNDDQILAAVLSKSVDYGMGDPIFTAIANERGAKTKTVAMLITNLALGGYTNKPEVPVIEKPEQLAGLRVGSFPAPSTAYVELEKIKRDHPELKSMKVVQGAMGTQLALLQADKTDIAIDLEPAFARAITQGNRFVLNLSKLTLPKAITGLITRQSVIDEKPDQVQRMVTAMQQALTAIYSDRKVAYRTARKLFPDLGDVVLKKAVDHMLSDAMYPKSVVVRDDYWQRSIKMRLDSGALKKPQATSVAVDNRFAKKAVEERK
ncbi:MAG TPA: hypothetical protein DD400_04670 [Rhodospirillaceae bacterium]|nr:hypothetical protein [Rhodospirillaceae bacterium]